MLKLALITLLLLVSSAQDATSSEPTPATSTSEHAQINPTIGAQAGTPTLNATPPPTSSQQKPQEQPVPQKPQSLIDVALYHDNQPQRLIEQSSNERILNQGVAEPSNVIEGTVNGQQVHYEKSQADQVSQLEAYKVQSLNINYEHIKTYSFEIAQKSSFVIKVDHDVEIKGVATVYWNEGEAYADSRFQQGEEVTLTIYQDHGVMLYNENCYHTIGFKFYARKGHSYNLNFATTGRRKLISMLTENYLTERKGAEKLHTQHAEQHQMKTQKVKNTLRTFLGVVEKNFMMNQQIAYNVTLHSKRYMSYQIIQMIFVILGACTQIYLMKRLLNPHSVV